MINSRLASISNVGKSTTLQFALDGQGHYAAQMNHDAQKYREEDFLVCMCDCLESLGWNFKFQ